jgi:hypothetical protein
LLAILRQANDREILDGRRGCDFVQANTELIVPSLLLRLPRPLTGCGDCWAAASRGGARWCWC